MASREPRRHSNLAECVISATILGRALIHQQTSLVEKAYSSPPTDYLVRRNWLEGLLNIRIENLHISRPQDGLPPDPMTAFTTILIYAAVLYLWHIADLLLDKNQDQSLLLPLSVRGLEAAQHLCQLAQDFEFHGLFKAHIFLPIPLFFAAYRLRSHLEMEGSNIGDEEKAQLEKQIDICLEGLQKLQTVNNLSSRVLFQYNTRPFRPV